MNLIKRFKMKKKAITNINPITAQNLYLYFNHYALEYTTFM